MAGKPKENVIYMAVTPDQYELPLYWENSRKELAEKLGVPPRSITSDISHKRSGVQRGFKYVRIELEEDDNE